MNGVAPFKHTLPLDIFRKSYTVYVLHDDILNFFRKAYVEYLYDIRVRQKRDSLRLVAKTAQKILARRKFVFEYLYRNDPILGEVFRLINVRHSADADKLDKLISPVQLLADIFIHINNPFF